MLKISCCIYKVVSNILTVAFQSIKHTSLDELPTMLPKDQLSTTQEIQDNVCNKINHGNDVGGQRSKCNTPSNQMAPIEKSSSCTTSPAIVSSSLSQKTTSLKSPNHKKPELMQTQSGNFVLS